MKYSILSALMLMTLALPALAGETKHNAKPSKSLVAAAEAIKKLDAADYSAFKAWFEGKGRQALRDRGLTNSQIGGMRLDTDKLGDAPLGK